MMRPQPRKRKARCRFCKGYTAKRFCPAVGGMICADCCRKKRGKIPGCDAKCRYFVPLIAKSQVLPEPEWPSHLCLISESKETGMVIVVLARAKPNGRLKAMFFLIDLWKRGIRDAFILGNVSKEELKKECAKIGGYNFSQLDFDEGRKIVRRGYLIAKNVKTELPWEYQRWASMLGSQTTIPDPQGSMYKCAKCGSELPDYIVELMSEHSQSDEFQFYMVCKRCGGDFEE